jgi:ribosomal protein S18 acetylase RimI-like enzyme
MTKKLWQQNDELDEFVEAFETKADLAVDQKLVKADVAGSLAHAMISTKRKGRKKLVKIRRARPTDFDELYRLWQAAGLKLAPRLQEKTEFESLIKLNRDSCLVALADEEIIAGVLAAFNGRRAWLYHLAVRPGWQEQGYGSALVRKAEKILKNRGATKIVLSVHISNLRTVPFYEKNGYEVKNSCVLMAKTI